MRPAKLVISSPSSPHDGDSKDFSEAFGNSPKQGRKTDAETKGRKIDFGDEGDFDFGVTEEVDTQEEVSQQQLEQDIFSTATTNFMAITINSNGFSD